jgi:hypothetical protein
VTHARRECGGELVERDADVALKGRRREALDERAAEVERAQFREGEPGVVEPLEGALLERPVLAAVMGFIEQREASRLQRLEIAADRPRRHARAGREIVDGQSP